MFGLGMSELLVLGILALILIGPKQLPEVARTLGRFINDLKRSAEGVSDELKKQAKMDLDIDINKDFFEPRKKTRDPDLPLKIMQDPRIQNKIEGTTSKTEENGDIVLSPPENTTLTFDPTRSIQVAQADVVSVEKEKTENSSEKKE